MWLGDDSVREIKRIHYYTIETLTILEDNHVSKEHYLDI